METEIERIEKKTKDKNKTKIKKLKLMFKLFIRKMKASRQTDEPS